MVSIIIPSYNDACYVPEALASALAQTYPDVEILLVDDGSDDAASIEQLQRCAQHPSVRLIRIPHAGLSAARNAGIREAKGKYIMLLDADNKYAPTYVEKAVEIAESMPNVGIVYGDAELFGEQSGHWDLPEFSLPTMLLNNVIDAAALFRKTDWEQVGGFSEDLQYGMEDYDFWLSLLELGREVYKVPEVLFYYRVRSKSMVHRLYTNQNNLIEAYECIHRRHAELYQANASEYIVALQKCWREQIAYISMLEETCSRLKHVEQSFYMISNSTIWKASKPVRKIVDGLKLMFRKK